MDLARGPSFRWAVSVFVFTGLFTTSAAAGGRGEFLVESQWLASHLEDRNLVILDARNLKSYQSGHIPGAVHAWWEDLSKTEGNTSDTGWGVVLPPKALARQLGKRGISNDSKVVVYADSKHGWGEDGRVVWMLRMAGVKWARMLDGGLDGWKRTKGPVTAKVPRVSPVKISLGSYDPTWAAGKSWVQSNLHSATILDSRTLEEYNGAVLFGEARGGRLPGAISFSHMSSYRKDGTIKSLKELKQLFAKVGIKKNDDVVVYCTAGIRSAHLTIMLRMAGYSKARNYDASFYEWASDLGLELH